jgi:linoleoyl-CoA desaturase
MAIPKFTNVPHSFHSELKKRISDYFEEVGKSTTGTYSLFIKAVILMVSTVLIYIHLVFLPFGQFWNV